MAHLTTVPTFTFWQEKKGEEYETEKAVQVSYYNGSIELTQGNQNILIDPEMAKELFKEILKHQQEAENLLNKKLEY